MPFTLSHAAAVLPAIRRDGSARAGLIPSALVAGSFAPDITYFVDSVLPGAMRFGGFTHTFLGVVTVNVLIAAGLVAVWAALREPLVALLPVRVRGRVHSYVRGQRWTRETFGPTGLLRFAGCAALGAATHVVWDAFTHHSRWGTELLPFLNRSVGGFPLYQFAQYGSSAVALVVLGWFVVTGLRRTAAVPVPEALPELGRGERRGALGLLALCVLLGAVHRCVRWYAHFGQAENLLDLIPTACFGAGAGLAAGLLLYGVWMRLPRRRLPEDPEQAPMAEGSRAEASAGRK
ncbi:hypothetical protein B7C62_06665 [Kitasatospora albolonga]|uniref:DUF4184 domain-containing protein n=1 Tax=Kitasatospora albolonga TaxID=68173 RepID=A0ABC8BPA1_9ACTN|nr:hypothetical protein B7C62_06665 [Kitasatospora albolonga]